MEEENSDRVEGSDNHVTDQDESIDPDGEKEEHEEHIDSNDYEVQTVEEQSNKKLATLR